jgi:hypothetical protein
MKCPLDLVFDLENQRCEWHIPQFKISPLKAILNQQIVLNNNNNNNNNPVAQSSNGQKPSLNEDESSEVEKAKVENQTAQNSTTSSAEI